MSMEEDNQNEYLNSNIARWISNINKLEFLYVMKKRLLVIRQFCSSFGFYVYKIMWVKLIFIVKLFKIGGKKFYLGAILIFTASIIILNKNSFSTFQSNASNRLLSEKNISYSYDSRGLSGTSSKIAAFESKLKMSSQRMSPNGFPVEFTKNGHILKLSKKLECEQNMFGTKVDVTKNVDPYVKKIISSIQILASELTELIRSQDPSQVKSELGSLYFNDDFVTNSPFIFKWREHSGKVRLIKIGNVTTYADNIVATHKKPILCDLLYLADAVDRLLDITGVWDLVFKLKPLIRFLMDQPSAQRNWFRISDTSESEVGLNSPEVATCIQSINWNLHFNLPVKSESQEDISIHLSNMLRANCRSQDVQSIVWRIELQLPISPNGKQSIKIAESLIWTPGQNNQWSIGVNYEFRF